MPNVLEQARALLEDVTPLAVDCGQVCDGRCCRPSEGSTGMLLFPGEDALMHEGEILPAAGGQLYVCGGHCRRENRPLACRIFPLFPYVEKNGRVRAVYDPRAWRLCPLVQQHAHVPLQRDFVCRVRRVGRILLEDTACATFLRQQSEEIRELNRLLPLKEARTPIMRKKYRQKQGVIGR